MTLPQISSDEIIQVVMHGAFYNTFFRQLCEQQDFNLLPVPGSQEEESAGLRTFVMGFGERRAELLKDRP